MGSEEEVERRLQSLEYRVAALEGGGQELAVGYLEQYRAAMKKIEEKREKAAMAALEARFKVGKTEEMDDEDVEDAKSEWMKH